MRLLDLRKNNLFRHFRATFRHFRVTKILLCISAFVEIIILREIYCYISPSAALSRIKRDIQNEFANFNYSSLYKRTNVATLNELTPETGGKPIINLIITNFRSGSTFLGQTINSFPGGYYHFEPLLYYRSLVQMQISDDFRGIKAVNELLRMFHCDFSGLNDYIVEAKKKWAPLFHNKRVKKRLLLPHFYSLEFLSKACELFPIQNMKVTRLALKFARYLLDDESLNLKIIYLIRDPRGVLRSCWDISWGSDVNDFYTATGLCEAMVDDYNAAKELIKNYPSRFSVVRYEDFSSSPFHSTIDMFKFLSLPFHKNVADFVDTHTKGCKKDLFSLFYPQHSTYRDTSARIFRWKNTLTYDQILDIQDKCHDALKLWGYKEAQSQHELETNFNPIYPFGSDLKIIDKRIG